MKNYKLLISESNCTIYDPLDAQNSSLYISTSDLLSLLNGSLVGEDLSGMAPRTRSKHVKSLICSSLGYPIPAKFEKTQPRFPGQNFDTYIQESNNLQIWNEPIDPTRRYIIIRVNENHVIAQVKILEGQELQKLDTTGKLTIKYQATMVNCESKLFSTDTKELCDYIKSPTSTLSSANPDSYPKPDEILPIEILYSKLLPLVGTLLPPVKATQDRTRGDWLHKAICKALGYSYFADDGQYPDIKNQFAEIKLQTSPTIDLGLHSPSDPSPFIFLNGRSFSSQDIRYIIFSGKIEENGVRLIALYLCSGQNFYNIFPQFKGKVKNAKLQLPLPNGFWNY